MSSAKTAVERSDIFRLDVLCAFGGSPSLTPSLPLLPSYLSAHTLCVGLLFDVWCSLYIDTDFECVAGEAGAADSGFEALHRRYACYVGVANTSAWEVNNGLVACAANHPFITSLIDSMKLPATASTAPGAEATATASQPPQPSAYSILERTGPGHWTKCLFEAAVRQVTSTAAASSASTSAATPPATDASAAACAPQSQLLLWNTIVLPLTFFYPFPNSLRALPACDRVPLFVRRESLAVHHWEGAWKPALAAGRAPTNSSSQPQPQQSSAASANPLADLLQKLSAVPSNSGSAPTSTAAGAGAGAGVARSQASVTNSESNSDPQKPNAKPALPASLLQRVGAFL
jgi:hypothetical protein